MIGRLTGTIIEKQPPIVVIEAAGVGYEVHLPMTCIYALPELQQQVSVFIHFVVREDAQLLYGFNHRNERTLFRELIKVNGVGPRLALAILSGMSAQQFVSVVEKQEIGALIKLPGVGKKTAERLVVEMKDRLSSLHADLFAADVSLELTNPSTVQPALNHDFEAEAVAALISLGYKPPEASKMIAKVARSDSTSELMIREALRSAL